MIALERVCHTDIEEEELGCGNRLSLSGLLVGGKLVADESVFQNLVVLTNRTRWKSRIVGDSGEVDLLPTGDARHLKKAREILDGSRQALSTDLFAEVGPHISFEILQIVTRI